MGPFIWKKNEKDNTMRWYSSRLPRMDIMSFVTIILRNILKYVMNNNIRENYVEYVIYNNFMHNIKENMLYLT